MANPWILGMELIIRSLAKKPARPMARLDLPRGSRLGTPPRTPEKADLERCADYYGGDQPPSPRRRGDCTRLPARSLDSSRRGSGTASGVIAHFRKAS